MLKMKLVVAIAIVATAATAAQAQQVGHEDRFILGPKLNPAARISGLFTSSGGNPPAIRAYGFTNFGR